MVIYVNFDLETTGMSPDRCAIIQIGAVAHESERWTEIGSFAGNIAIPPNRGWEEATRKWWEEDSEAGPEKLQRATENVWSTGWACQAFFDWLLHLPHVQLKPSFRSIDDARITFVGNPIAYDLPFLRSYMREYVGEEWLSWTKENKTDLYGVDLPTMAMSILGRPYLDSRRRKWPKDWVDPITEHTHIAIDDARSQSYAFIKMMRHLRDMRDTAHSANPGLSESLE